MLAGMDGKFQHFNYQVQLLNLCSLTSCKKYGNQLDSELKNKNEIQEYVRTCLYLLGIIWSTGLFPQPEGKFFMLSFHYFIRCKLLGIGDLNPKAQSSAASSRFSS